VSNIVIPPANTGKAKSNKYVVTKTDQINKGNRNHKIFFFCLVIVLIKFKAPKIDLAPAKCKEKIPKSIPNPE
jgi:hypothetical protein